MIITQLEDVGRSKVKVYIDDEYAFLLYQKEINHFNLREGEEISQSSYEIIIEEKIYYRAKEKALSILKYMDRTEEELRKKLEDAGYAKDIIRRTISYVSQYGFLSDDRYALDYVKKKMYTKSKLVIKTQLQQKGINKEIIDKAFVEEYDNLESEEDPELKAIQKVVAKKSKDIDALSVEEKQKLLASLYRKGFQINKIKKVLDCNIDM